MENVSVPAAAQLVASRRHLPRVDPGELRHDIDTVIDPKLGEPADDPPVTSWWPRSFEKLWWTGRYRGPGPG